MSILHESLYTQDLGKRIMFTCKNCNSEMKYSRSLKRVIIECPKCKMYFVVTGEVKTNFITKVKWVKPQKKHTYIFEEVKNE